MMLASGVFAAIIGAVGGAPVARHPERPRHVLDRGLNYDAGRPSQLGERFIFGRRPLRSGEKPVIFRLTEFPAGRNRLLGDLLPALASSRCAVSSTGDPHAVRIGLPCCMRSRGWQPGYLPGAGFFPRSHNRWAFSHDHVREARKHRITNPTVAALRAALPAGMSGRLLRASTGGTFAMADHHRIAVVDLQGLYPNCSESGSRAGPSVVPAPAPAGARWSYRSANDPMS